MTLRELWFRLTYPTRKGRIERELREEMELHLALRTEQLEKAGLSHRHAAAVARRQFGNRSRIASASRDAWGWHWLEGLAQDTQYVSRQLCRAPVFSLIVCATIALGIAVNTTAFSFYDAIAFKQLPVADAGRVIRVVQGRSVFGSEVVPFSAYDVIHSRARTLSAVVALTAPQALSAVLPGYASNDSRVVNTRFTTPDFAQMLGVRASIGRWFDSTDDHAVVVDHGFWMRRLGGDTSVVGQRLRLGDAEVTIIGVAAPDFAGTGLPAAAPDLWMPMSLLPTVMRDADWRNDGRAHWQLIGRLASGATAARVTAELAMLSRSIPDSVGKPVPLLAKRATFFQTDAGGEFEVFQQMSAAFMIALTLILGIAAVNLVNLFAARNAARERELSVRLALGASRARVARQLVTESVLLALVGGAIGIVASRGLATWLRDWIVATLASVSGGIIGVTLDVGLDWRVAAYAALLSIVIGLAVGLWPALSASRKDAGAVLRQGSTSTGGAGVWNKRNVLLSAQIASSLILLTVAGMLLSGMRLSRNIDPRFDAGHMLVVDVQDDAPMLERAARRSEIIRRISTLPGVRAVAWTQRVPFGGTHLRSVATSGGPLTISVDQVAETYFDAMGLPVTHGRAFTRQEVETNAPVMVVSASMARLRWPYGDAIGKSVPPTDPLVGPDTTKSYTVIGIVGEVRSQFLSRLNGPSVYYPYAVDRGYGGFIVRTRGEPASAIDAVRTAVTTVSSSLASRTHVLTLEGGPMALQRLMAEAPAATSLALAAAGLVLAAVGVYGVISQIVTARTREIGVRIAMGATPLHIIRLVAVRTLRPVAWGAAVGAFGAVSLSLFVRSLVATPDVPDLTFGAGAFSPMVFLGVAGVLALVVTVACYVPTRRAMRMDPTAALRAE
jgi:predicted permease